MKIIKYKKTSKDKYKLFLDNNESITLFEDVIVNNNLLLSKEIDKNTLDDLIKQNNDMYVYNIAIKYISIKMRSTKEIKEYLSMKGIDVSIIKSTINKLLDEGYLNDEKFTTSYINDQMNLSPKGPLKIRKELLKYGINETIINDNLNNVNEEEVKEKLSKLLEKQIKLKKGSSNALKVKLVNYFINLGYEKEMITAELSKYELKSDKNKLIKDYQRLYNRYKDKYEGSKLTYFIAQKLYSKGYTGDDISSVIKEFYYE